MNSSAVFNSMKKLITRKYYATKEEIYNKLDVFYACNRLTDDEYTELMALVEEYYNS